MERKFYDDSSPRRFKENCQKFIQDFEAQRIRLPRRTDGNISERFAPKEFLPNILSSTLSKSCDCGECCAPKKVKTLMMHLLGRYETKYSFKLLIRHHRRKRVLWRFKKIVNGVLFLMRYRIMREQKLRNKRRLLRLLKPRG